MAPNDVTMKDASLCDVLDDRYSMAHLGLRVVPLAPGTMMPPSAAILRQEINKRVDEIDEEFARSARKFAVQ